jgi:hypothetical protein
MEREFDQGKPDVKPDRLLDDFQREPVPLVADFLHPPGYLTASGTASPNRRDKAVASQKYLQDFPKSRAKSAFNLLCH